MRHTILLAALLGIATASPKPQDMDFDAIDSAVAPPVTGPPVDAVSDPVSYNEEVAMSSVAAAVATDPATPNKRSVENEHFALEGRGVNDPCSRQPDGQGPKPPNDTVAAFQSYSVFSDTANNAATPQGYRLSFSNLAAASNANSYMGFYTFSTYDTIKCQQLCDSADLCTAFNIYFERDPTIAPNDTSCPNPPSFTNIKCSLWGSGVTPETAVNSGQYRSQFHVVIAGSNGYTKDNPPNPQTNFTGPVELGGAINAPVSPRSYIGVKYCPGVYDGGECAAACQATTAYNHRHPHSDGTYDACNFFNVYLLSKNNVPQGTYCSLYTQTWGKQYSTNYGQYRGSDYYSVSSSYGYTLTAQDPGHV